MVLAACANGAHERAPDASAAPNGEASVGAVTGTAHGGSIPTPAPAPTRTAAPRRPPPFDAGVTACRALRAPYVDPDFIAPVALRLREDGATPTAQLVFNDTGVPHVVDVPADDKDASAAISASRTRTTLPSCAVAGDAIVCPDASGVVQAWRGDRHTILARARPGTDVAAATIDGKLALAFVADHVTSEGVMREAWVVLEGGEPVRISEEGSGATFIELATRGKGLLAMMIDARVAMTPAHARSLALVNGALSIGPDAVVFVGGSAEPHNGGALATTSDGTAFELVAVADGATTFGMAAIRVEDPPRVDEPVVWSLYPNGLDPAPIAATHDRARMLLARVRPRDPEPHAPRDLELGELAQDGVFAPSCVIDEAPFIKDVEIALDKMGALWVFYRDPRGSVLERRALPPRR
jgi:hypothetical protein